MPSFTFPDSKIEIEIERLSPTAVSMLEAHYYAHFEKPERPYKEVGEDKIPIQDPKLIEEALKNKSLDDESRQKLESDLKAANKYLDDLTTYDRKVRNAIFLATRLMYAKRLKSPVDVEKVKFIIDDGRYFGMDYYEQTRQMYKDAEVPFDEELMEKWIYLWLICAASAIDSGMLASWMGTGSEEARKAMQLATSAFRYSL